LPSVFGSKLIQRVFAVLAFGKLGWHPLLAPGFLPSPSWVLGKVLISVIQISIDGVPGFLYAGVIAVLNDSLGHSAEFRLNHIQKLCTGRQGSSPHYAADVDARRTLTS
jgi:hypothetical protein